MGRAVVGYPVRMEAPAPIATMIDRLEHEERLDSAAAVLARANDVVASGTRGEVLHGQWLGHALHPLMTDLPLGCWLASGLLDLGGGRRGRAASRRLVGIGLLFAVPTALTGVADYSHVGEQRDRRIAVVHAAGNAAVMGFYLLSWRARRAGHHWRGTGWGLAGGGLAWFTGYLGGHLSFARGTGVGPRGLPSREQSVTQESADFEPVVASG
jgi:uncharacterized membrane protein